MDYRSDVRVDDTRAAEVGMVCHEGREFASGGFAIDVEQGRMIAYVGRVDGVLHLTTWEGAPIVALRHTGSARGWHCTILECYSTAGPIAGYYWHGRGLGEGMSLRLVRGRKG